MRKVVDYDMGHEEGGGFPIMMMGHEEGGGL